MGALSDWWKKQKKKNQNSAQKAYKKHKKAEQTRQKKGASSSSYDSVRKKAQPKTTPPRSGSTGGSSGGSTRYNRGGSTRGSSSRGNERRSGAYRARETAGTGVSKAQTSLNKSAEKTYKGRKVGTYTATKAGPVRRDTTVTKSKTSTGTVRNLTERNERKTTTPGKGFNDSLKRAANANKDFDKNAPEWVKKVSDKTAKAANIGSYAAKDMAATGMRLAASTLDGPKDRRVRDVDYSKSGDSLKAAAGLKKGEKTTYKPAKLKDGERRDSRGNIVRDVKYGEYVDSDGKIKPLKDSKAKNIQKKINDTAGKWEESAEKDVQEAVKDFSDDPKYTVPNLGLLNKVAGIESTDKQRKAAENDVKTKYRTQWTQDKETITKDVNDYFKEEMGKYGLSEDTVLDNGLTVAQYRNQVLEESLNERLTELKEGREKDLEKTKDVGKLSPKDVAELGAKGVVGLAEFAVPYAGTAGKALKAADTILAAGKAGKAAKGAKALTEAAEGGAKRLSVDGRKLVRDYATKVANGEKPAKALADLKKQINMSDLKQNVKRELLANAVQDATVGATLDAASAKAQGLEGKDLAKYMGQSALMNVAFGVPMAGIAGRTTKAGKRAIASDIKTTMNAEFKKVGKMSEAKASELLNLVAKQDGGIELTAKESQRLADLQKEQLQSRSGIVQMDSKGKLVVNEGDVTKSVISEPELKEYTKLQAQYNAGVLKASDEGRLRELDEKISGAHDAVAYNADVVLKYGGKTEIDRRNLESAVSYFKQTGDKAKLRKAQALLDKDIKAATKRNESLSKALDNMSERTGIKYRLVSNDEMNTLTGNKLSADGYFIKGEYRIGEDGTPEILINRDSPQAHQTVIGHETGHLLKDNNVKQFEELGKDLRDYAKDIGEFEEFEKRMRKNYPDLKEEALQEEITCELLGRYIFGENSDFINRLSKEKPSIVRRIVEYVKKLTTKVDDSDLATRLKNMTDTAEDLIGKVNVEEVKKNVKAGQAKQSKVGENSAGLTNIQKINRGIAEIMRDNGIDNNTIKKISKGWYIGKDGLPRLEISDAKATIDMNAIKNSGVGKREVTLGNILTHDTIYRHYPKAEKMKVVLDPDLPRTEGANGMMKNGVMYLNPNRGEQEIRKTVLHELQHYIQGVEGFTRGSSPKRWKAVQAGIDKGIDSILTELNNAGVKIVRRDIRRVNKGNPADVKTYVEGKIKSALGEEKAKEFTEYIEDAESIGYNLYEKLNGKSGWSDTPNTLYRATGGELESRDTVAKVDMSQEALDAQDVPDYVDSSTRSIDPEQYRRYEKSGSPSTRDNVLEGEEYGIYNARMGGETHRRGSGKVQREDHVRNGRLDSERAQETLAQRNDTGNIKESEEVSEPPQSGSFNAEEAKRHMDAQADAMPAEALKEQGPEPRFSKVRVEDTTEVDGRSVPTLQYLNEQEARGDVIEVYRAMAMIDGKLYPPMATKWKGGKLQDPAEKGEWLQSDERPDLIKRVDKNGVGKFDLLKDNGETVADVAYNPYIHSSPSMMNDQFSSAYIRPNMVVVRGVIPKSELTSGYKAEYAKDAVGQLEWKAGPVAEKLPNSRQVYLTRWFKPVDVVPDNEVAQFIKGIVDSNSDVIDDIPFNVVTPSVRKELEKIGVPIGEAQRLTDAPLKADVDNRRMFTERMEQKYGDSYTEDFGETEIIYPRGNMPKMGNGKVEDHALDFAKELYGQDENALAKFINAGNAVIDSKSRTVKVGADIRMYDDQRKALQNFFAGKEPGRLEFVNSKGEVLHSVDFAPEGKKKVSKKAVEDEIKAFFKREAESEPKALEAKNTDTKQKFSIVKMVKDEQGNTYENVVKLDTKIFDDLTTKKEKADKLHKFVYENLAGHKFTAYNDDGTPVTIELARADETHKKIGAKRGQNTLDDIAEKPSHGMRKTKTQKAAAQADELIEVSTYDRSSSSNVHGKLDRNGWEYRTLKVMGEDGGIHDCVLSIAKAEDGRNILYDIKIKKKIGQAVEAADGDLPVSPISKQNVPKSEPEVKTESETNMAEAFDKARQGKYSKERIDKELPELRRLEKEGKLTESQKTRLDYLETRVAEAETESEAGVRSISDQRTKFETLSAQKEELERRLSDLNDRIQTTQNKNPRNPRQRNKALARQEQYEQIEKQIAEIDDQLKTSPELRKLERDLRKEQVYHLGPAIKKYGADSKQVKRINERIDALKRDIATQKAREAQPPVKKPKRMTPKTEAPKTEAPKPEAPKPEPDALHKAAKVSITPVESMSKADLRKELKQLNGGIRFGKTKEHIELRKQRRDEIKAELDRRTEWEIENLRGITDEQMAPDDPGHSIKPNEEIRKPAEPTQKVNKVAIENISKEIPRTRQPEWIRSARRLVVNSLAGFEDHAKIIGDNKMLTQINHVQHWTNKFAAWIEGDRSGMDRKVSGEGLNTIFDKANLFGKKGLDKRNDFVNYLTYKHAIDRLKYDKPVHADPDSGMSLYSEKDYRDMMAEIERKYTESGEIKQLEQFEKDIRAYYDDVMKMRVDSGLVSKEFAEELQKKYPNYIPTLREGDEWLQNGSKEGSRQEFAVDESIKTAKGGSEDILDLYQSTMRITRDVIRDAEQNELISQYAKSIGVDVTKVSKEAQAELPNFAAYASKTEKGWRVSFFQNGEMVRMNVDKQIARGLREINGQEFTRLMNLASKMSGPMRAFKAPITDYNVIFGVRNGARDIQQAAVNSKSLRHFTASIPTAQASILRKNIPGQTTDPWMKSYEANGGMYSTFARQDTEFGKKYVEPKSGGAVKKGLDATAGRALRGLENVNSAIEATPRMAEYIGTIKKDVDAQLRKEGSSLKKFKEDLQKELYGDKELTDAQTEKFSDVYAQRILDMASEETISNAARNAADITLNFSRNGVIGKALNMGFVPYFNPSIQGLSKTVRMFTENGAEGSKALLNFGMKVGVITMAPAAINEILCADNRDYQNLATREKDTNFFIPIGDGKFIKIPKPRENAVMAEPVTYGLRYFLEKASIGEIELPGGIGKDGVIMEGEYSQWKDLGQAFVSAHDNIAPIPISDNLFSPLVRLAQNKTWYGGSIESVGEVLGKKEGELKNSEIYDNTTSAWAIQIGNTKIGGKKISDITHLSPKKIDDLMDSYLGVMYDLGISQTAEVTNGNPIVNQFIKDSVFSNKTGSELWTEFEHANSPKDLKGKAIQKAKDTVLGHSAWNIKEKSIEAKDWLNQKGYDDMTYSSGIQTIREDTSIPEKDKADIIRRVKKAQNEARTDLVYGSKEIHWKKDPLRLFADIVGVDKAMKDYTYTYVDPETGEKKNQHLDAWNAYKKSDEYKDNKGKAGKKWMDFYSKMRWTNGRIGEAKSYPSWMAASVIAATDKGDNTELAKAYIRPISYEDGKSLDTERQADIIQRGVNLQNELYKQSRYRQSQKTIFQAGRDLGYEYTSEMNPWDKTMALATAGKKYEDTNYYASDTSGKISRRMPYARCLNEKGYSTKQIYDFAKEYDIKLPDTNNMDKDQYVATMKAFNAKVEAAVKDKYGDRPLEEQAAVYHVITDDYYNKPFGDIGDYGLENDTGITDLDAKSGGGYRRRRRGRRGWRRRGYGGWGGGGGGGSTKAPEKTPSGAYEITAGKVTKAKVTNPFVGDYTKPSNLDDAYRKRAKKLREANSKSR